MNKKLIRNIIIALFAIAILIVGCVLALKWNPEKKTEDQAPIVQKDTITILELETSEISSIDITNEKGHILLKHTGDDYTVSGMENADLVKTSVARPFIALKSLTATKIIKENADKLSDFGLENPKNIAIITKTDGSSITLKIGDMTPAKDGYYVSVNDEKKVYLTSEYTVSSFLSSIDDFRDTSLGELDFTNLTSFELYKGSELVCEIHRKNENDNLLNSVSDTLVMSKPYHEYLNSNKFIELFQNITTINATSVVEDGTANASSYGIGEYSYKITDSNGSHTIKLGRKADNGDVYAVIEGKNAICTINHELYDIAKAFNPLGYIYRFVHIYNLDEVEKIEFSSGLIKHTLAITDRSNPKKLKCSINNNPIDDDDFKEAFQEIIGITFTDVAKNPKAEQKIGSISFTMTDGTIRTTDYYQYDNSNYMAKAPNGNCYIVLKKTFDHAFEEVFEEANDD